MDRDAFLAGMREAVDAANERVERCHERVACPTCLAPVGERCADLRGNGWAVVTVEAGGRRSERATRLGRELKHPHSERARLVQPAR